jgi:hypothetical protein
VCWPERMRGSGTLPVSRVCDTVVMWERRGRRYVGGNGVRDSRSVLRAERANRAMAGCVQWLRAYIYLFLGAEVDGEFEMAAKAR